MPGDLNSAHTLFGGTIMKWADEAVSIYVMCQLGTKKVVTLKVSEILFKEPVQEGDVLEFMASTVKVGNTSITVKLDVQRKSIEDKTIVAPTVLSCEFVFVAVDDKGRPTQHKLSKRV
jgi:acyl-CoA thioesterase YciA